MIKFTVMAILKLGVPEITELAHALKEKGVDLGAGILTENEFMDCEESLRFIESEEGKEAIIGLHVDGILDFIDPTRQFGYMDLKTHRR